MLTFITKSVYVQLYLYLSLFCMRKREEKVKKMERMEERYIGERI